ncbi:lasso RiPP family leader peptide-containing protein [Nocardiopsis mangrovi]|uniref:Lasso RiPP family leader peptide-containing protein n=1 Tax=Nocardiopsis mangrovi TaxID=1179818 RepID=A0ABV9DYY1_9ACTN
MNDNEPIHAPYEPPKVIEVGDFCEMTRGQYASEHADDGSGAGYWSQPVKKGPSKLW